MFNVLAYASAICIFLLGLCPATTVAAILLSAPEALSIARAFNPSFKPWQLLPGSNARAKGSGEKGRNENQQRPYRLEGLVVRILKHAPGVVLAVFADTVLREAIAAGTAAAAAAADDSGVLSFPYRGKWLSGVAGVLFSTSLLVRSLPLVPFVCMFFLSSPRPRAPPTETSQPAAGAKEKAGVIVAGGGVGGLVLGACLQELGLPFEVMLRSRPLVQRKLGSIGSHSGMARLCVVLCVRKQYCIDMFFVSCSVTSIDITYRSFALSETATTTTKMYVHVKDGTKRTFFCAFCTTFGSTIHCRT